MATESPLLGQLRHIPSSPVISGCAEPRPPGPDPLQGLVQEMALSAVMQKHGSNAPSSAPSSHSGSNGAIIKNYILPVGSTTAPSPAEQFTAVAVSAAQQPSMVLSGATGNMQQGFITLPGTQATGTVSLLPQTHTSSILQATSLTAVPQQLQEVNSTVATAGMVQLTQVYEGAANSAQPSPVMERSSLVQPNM